MASVPLVGTGLLLLLLSTCHHSEGCDSNTTALTGTVESPNFPNDYPNSQDCVYVIKAPEEYRVTLIFTDFDLEAHPGCLYDFVEIRDGNATSPLIGRYCSSSLPSPIRTFGNQMRIRFVSDSDTTGRGFRATFASAPLKEAPFFLIASAIPGSTSGGAIHRMDVVTGTNYIVPMNETLYRPTAVDYDPVEQTIYWSETGQTKGIRASSLDGSDMRTVLSDAGSVIYGLAVDPWSRYIFYTDTGRDLIARIDMSPSANLTTIIDTDLLEPRAIVLDTYKGVMFWTDWGYPKIERANYNGTERTTLLTTGVRYVNGLALDRQNDVLYWVDAYTERVEMCDTQGKNRRSVLILEIGSTFHFFDVAYLNGYLYITDWNDGLSSTPGSVYQLDLATSNFTVFGPVEALRLNGIHVHDPRLSPLVVTTTDPQPFDTDGEQQMTLSCDHNPTVNVTSYEWNVSCTSQAGRTCNFKPRLAEDDGQVVTCTASLSTGYVASGELTIHLNYPPPDPPTIQGYSKDRRYQVGDSLRMTCSVHGGKPLVSAVFFSCDTHPDSDPDIFGTTEVHSVLTIGSLSASDDGQTCTCTARWKDTDWYQLNATVVLKVHGTSEGTSEGTTERTSEGTTERTSEGTSEGTSDSFIAIAAGCAVAGAILIAIIIFIVCIVEIRKTGHDKSRRKRRRAREENSYSSVKPFTIPFTAPPTASGAGQLYFLNNAYEADRRSFPIETAGNFRTSR